MANIGDCVEDKKSTTAKGAKAKRLAYLGGGSTITQRTEPGALGVVRGKRLSVSKWARPQKQPKA